MFNNVINWLDGKKTHLCGIALLACGLAEACGYSVPAVVYKIIGGFGAIALKSALAKIEPKPPAI